MISWFSGYVGNTESWKIVKNENCIVSPESRCVNSCTDIFLWRSFSLFWLFFYLGFLSWALTIHRTTGKGKGPSFFLNTTSSSWETLRHLLAVTLLGCLNCIFNCSTCNYQTVPRWGFIELLNCSLIAEAMFLKLTNWIRICTDKDTGITNVRTK